MKYDKNRPWRRLYSLKRWKTLREMRLQNEPLCRMCKERFKRVRAATVCDHIIAHKGNEDLFFSYSNTQSLCKTCHDSHKQRLERGSIEKPEFGLDGYPL